MKTHAKIQADELDRYLTQLQSGEKAPALETLPESEIALLRELVALSEQAKPESGFASLLEDRLRSAERHAASSAAKRIPVRINWRLSLSLAGAMLLIVLSLLAFPSIRENILKASSNLIAQLGGATPAISLSATPAGGTASSPSSGTQSPSGGTQAVVEEPSLMPTPAITELPSLPQLATMFAGQYGGAGANPPQDIHYVLNTILPEGSDFMPAYVQKLPEPLSMEYVHEMARRFGLQVKVYMPQWMVFQASTDESPRKNYIAIEDPRQIIFEGTELIQYLDRSRSLSFEGHWYPPQVLPPLEQAILVAEEFLKNAGMLDTPYEIVSSGDEIRFYHVLDDAWSLSEPYAVVTISPDAQVSRVIYRDFNLESVGQYPMLSSEEAWEILSSGEPSQRIWLNFNSASAAWGEWFHANPKFWAREYIDGQHVDLFGALHILYPADAGEDPHVLMNELVLRGELQSMVEAYQTLMQSTLDTETPLHVWGVVQEADGYQILRVEGWETIDQYHWFGTIRWEGDRGYLQLDAGETLPLPNLPSDLLEGATVFVNGGKIGDGLQWSLIQEMPIAEAPIRGIGGTGITTHVEKVELIYFVPLLDSLPPDAASDFGLRSLQPVWRFSGRTDQGYSFEAYMQAVTDAFIREAE